MISFLDLLSGLGALAVILYCGALWLSGAFFLCEYLDDKVIRPGGGAHRYDTPVWRDVLFWGFYLGTMGLALVSYAVIVGWCIQRYLVE